MISNGPTNSCWRSCLFCCCYLPSDDAQEEQQGTSQYQSFNQQGSPQTIQPPNLFNVPLTDSSSEE